MHHNEHDTALVTWLIMTRETHFDLDSKFKVRTDDDTFAAYMDSLKEDGSMLHFTPFQMSFVRQQCREQGILVEGFDHPKFPNPESFGVVEQPARIDMESIPEAIQGLARAIEGLVAEIKPPQIDTESPAWTAYMDQCNAILSAQAEMEPTGIPDFKLHCPSKWVITPDELQAALLRASDTWQGDIVADSGQAAVRATIIHNAFKVALVEIAPGPDDFTVGGEVVLHRAIELLRDEQMTTPNIEQANEWWRSFIGMLHRGLNHGGVVVT